MFSVHWSERYIRKRAKTSLTFKTKFPESCTEAQSPKGIIMNFSTILECCMQFIDLGSNNCVNSMKSYTLNTLFSMCKPSKKQHFDAYSTPWKYSYYLLNKRLVN